MRGSRLWRIIPVLVLPLVFSPAAGAYNTPDGPSDLRADLEAPRGHGLITRQAITILRNDGHGEVARATEENLQAIFDGLRMADRERGRLGLVVPLLVTDIHLADFARNALTHFYNPEAPARKKGLIVLPLYYVPDTLLSRQLFALRGPHPSAHRMADWHYALAVQAMREGRTRDAYVNLGYVLHLVQDLSVPQHATDAYGLPHHRHQDYENLCDGYLGSPDFLATSGGAYFPDALASHYVTSPAAAAAPRASRVSWWHGNDFPGVARYLLPAAQRYTAGLLHKFHAHWRTEACSAVKLTVHLAGAMDRPDRYWGADLFVSLNVLEPGEPMGGRRSYSYDFRTDDFITGYIGDLDQVEPNTYLGCEVWTFPYTSDTVRPAEEVRMILALWDDDGTNAWNDDDEWLLPPHWIDINPDPGYRLVLKVNLRTGEVSRSAGGGWVPIGRVGERIVSRGNESDKDWTHGGRGIIDFTVDAIYLPEREAAPQPPLKPSNIAPAARAAGVGQNPTLMASVFADPDYDSHLYSEWRVMDLHSPSPIYQARTGPHIGHRVSTALAWGETYAWQVRYQDNTGRWSSWSTLTTFFTNNPPARPVNELPADGARGVPVTPHLTASAYSDFEGQPHLAAEWKIGQHPITVRNERTGEAGGVIAYRHVSARTTGHTVPSGSALRANTHYFWQVRYQDSLGAWSPWSAPTSFTTQELVLERPPVTVQPTPPPPAPEPPKPVPLPPAVAIHSPKGGENWAPGSVQLIAWQATGTGVAGCGVYYSTDGGASMRTILAKTAKEGVYQWEVPPTPSPDAMVRVLAYNDKGETLALADSARFTIQEVKVQHGLVVTAPNGGEYWFMGQSYDITWKASGREIARVDLDYSPDGGKSWQSIAAGVADTGSYSWKVPGVASQAALVRVSAFDSQGKLLATDQSDGVFTILKGQ